MSPGIAIGIQLVHGTTETHHAVRENGLARTDRGPKRSVNVVGEEHPVAPEPAYTRRSGNHMLLTHEYYVHTPRVVAPHVTDQAVQALSMR